MTSPASAGARFRAALTEESPLQVMGAITAYAGLMAKRPSMATASNMYIISEATASAIKRTSGVDLSSFSQRQKLFEETYAMILVIIDRDYQRVSFYHDGIKLPTTVGVRDLRNANKNTGPNIMDILSAYKQGAAPTL